MGIPLRALLVDLIVLEIARLFLAGRSERILNSDAQYAALDAH